LATEIEDKEIDDSKVEFEQQQKAFEKTSCEGLNMTERIIIKFTGLQISYQMSFSRLIYKINMYSFHKLKLLLTS